MTVRAKFHCTSVEHGSVYLAPVYSGSKENEEFFDATPGGQISLSITKPDFTPAGE